MASLAASEQASLRSTQTSPFIEFDNIGKSFQTQAGATVKALDDINLEIEEGEFISVVGPSGCGKSTLMRILAGLIEPTEGSSTIAGDIVDGPSPHVGVVFQQPSLFPWRKILKNIMLPAEITGMPEKKARERATELLHTVGLDGFGDHYPYELSGGMQQRVGIARALLHDPKVLLMDEPFGALDAMTRETMGLELLKVREATKKTVFFITHSVNEAIFLADRVVVMAARPGRVTNIFDVDLPRSRELSMMNTPEFGALATEIRSLLGAKTGD